MHDTLLATLYGSLVDPVGDPLHAPLVALLHAPLIALLDDLSTEPLHWLLRDLLCDPFSDSSDDLWLSHEV